MPEQTEKAEIVADGGGEKSPEMSPKLLARLFVVPLLIVVMIVACSLAVFLLFGWISEGREQSVERLVARIEAGAGDKLLDVAMLPKDREVWQAAVDLANRLQSDRERLSPEDRTRIAARLGAVLEKSLKIRQTEMGREMQQFLLLALGRLGQPESVAVLVAVATDPGQPVEVRRDAVAALVLMKQEPAARQAWPQLAALLDSPEPVLRIVTVVSVGALADRGDDAAIGVLRRACHSEDREVQWNAALALAQLGDASAVPLLGDMLTRSYWESVPVSLEPGENPDAQRRLTPARVEEYLQVTIDRAGVLGAPELRPKVEALRADPSPRVRDRAAKALAGWPSESRPPAAEMDASNSRIQAGRGEGAGVIA